jgi:hypothetical protein
VRSQALQPVAGVADASDGRVSNVEGDIAESARWNHNILDHRLLLDAAPWQRAGSTCRWRAPLVIWRTTPFDAGLALRPWGDELEPHPCGSARVRLELPFEIGARGVAGYGRVEVATVATGDSLPAASTATTVNV